MAIERLEQLLEIHRSSEPDPFILYGIALEYHKKEEFSEAESFFKQLLDLFPDYLPTYYQYGKMLSDLGSDQAAVKVLQAGSDLAQVQKDLKTKGELDLLIWELDED